MFSALKLAATGAVLALVGGLLFSLGAVTPRDGQVAPAAPDGEVSLPSFPTGLFTEDRFEGQYFDFYEDGTGRYFEHPGSLEVPFRYAVNGDLWTEMTHESPLSVDRQVPATYRWTWDGERLSFELWGEELNPNTRGTAMKNDFRLLADSRVVVVPRKDLAAGEPLESWSLDLDVVPAASVEPETFDSRLDVVSRTTAAPIEKGQPITPDLLEPAE